MIVCEEFKIVCFWCLRVCLLIILFLGGCG